MTARVLADLRERKSAVAWSAGAWRRGSRPRRTRIVFRRSVENERKQAGSGRGIGPAHWPAALSSEQSCISPYEDSRVRGIRCRWLVCAGVRTCDETADSRPHLCHKRHGNRTSRRQSRSRRRRRQGNRRCAARVGLVGAIARENSRRQRRRIGGLASRRVGGERARPPGQWFAAERVPPIRGTRQAIRRAGREGSCRP